LTDIEIYPKDSLYIFIQVFVNPTGKSLPLFIKDSIMFTINQHIQDVKLIAYGQDVHLLKKQTIKTQTWDADKPYLIYDTLMVDTLQTLTIAKGATIYFHRQSSMLIKGTLIAEGELANPITFQGDRLEQDYKDIPGQWGGIYFLPGSSGNKMNWTVIKNGTTGIQVGRYKSSSVIDLDLSNSIIQNSSYNSLQSIGAKIKAANCVISDGAMYSCELVGGDYEFYHCTVANYYGRYANRAFSSATLRVANYYMDSTATVPMDVKKANFYNSIVYGPNIEELVFSNKESALFNYLFDHCLLRSKNLSNSVSSSFINITWNKDPEFILKPKMYLELDTLSPAKDAGDISIGQLYPLDLKMVDRTISPDLGAYERVEKK
jgi:hypothetical protein